jgi:hypothetical protein
MQNRLRELSREHLEQNDTIGAPAEKFILENREPNVK